MLSMFSKILMVVFVLTVMAGLAEAQIVREGLISFWSFNEGTIKGDTVNDQWGENHGTMMNDPEVVEGIYGQALEFTGDNYVEVPDSDTLDIPTGEVSITVWVKRTGPGPTERGGIAEKGNGGIDNTPLLLREWNAGTVDFEVRSFQATPGRNWAKLQSDSIALVDDVWVFLDGTYDGKEEKIYVASVLDGTLANPGGYTNNDAPLMFGRDPLDTEPARFFVGVIDEIAIYDRALIPNEIRRNQDALAVESAGKLSFIWGEIKAQKTR